MREIFPLTIMEIENLCPFELDIYVGLFNEYVEEEKNNK